jgi:2-phosphosulfolactate phosphatase
VEAQRQQGHGLRFDWGLAGATAIARRADVAVVVDVLSFTTTLTVAVDAGVAVLPFRWDDARAVEHARTRDAVLAVGRSRARPGEISLSPATLRRPRLPERLVLPSPNGSTIAQRLSEGRGSCVGASLRNAEAVATWIADRHDPARTTVAVVAAGEQWPDGGLRPAVEDAWGAGAVIDHLTRAGWDEVSPEAVSARAAWRAVADDVANSLLACVSGQELVRAGFRGDVDIAAEAGTSRCVPVLQGDVFLDGA